MNTYWLVGILGRERTRHFLGTETSALWGEGRRLEAEIEANKAKKMN